MEYLIVVNVIYTNIVTVKELLELPTTVLPFSLLKDILISQTCLTDLAWQKCNSTMFLIKQHVAYVLFI